MALVRRAVMDAARTRWRADVPTERRAGRRSSSSCASTARRTGRGRAADAAQRLPAPRARADRDARRLRAGRLRRLHGPASTASRPLVPDVRRAGRRRTRSRPSKGSPSDGELDPIQQAFRDEHGLQCGFCTPGFLLATKALLDENPDPSDERDPRATCPATSAAARATRGSSPPVQDGRRAAQEALSMAA